MTEPHRERPKHRWLPAHVRQLLEWIARHELKVLLAMLFLAGSVWAFIEMADVVMAGRTMRFDEWAVRSLRRADDLSQPIGPQWAAEFGRDLTALGGVPFLTLLTVAIAGFLWLRRMYGPMLLLLAATIGGALLSLLLKSAYDRPRPEVVPHLVLTNTSSFPSGHAMLSATVFFTLGALLGRFASERVLKAYFLLVAMVLSGLVGLSRIYMGVHYPTDVLTGWMAGLAWAVACWLVARFLQGRHLVEGDLTPGEDVGQVSNLPD
jgi:undecaprenyl-diphosphatase